MGVTCGGRAALEMTCGEGEGRFPNRPYGLLGRSDLTAKWQSIFVVMT